MFDRSQWRSILWSRSEEGQKVLKRRQAYAFMLNTVNVWS